MRAFYHLFVLFAIFVLLSEAIPDSIRNYGDHNNFMCFAAQWNNGERVRQIYPLKRQRTSDSWYSTPAYYSYGSPYGASANTPDNLEESEVAQYFFFDGDSQDEGISLFIFFDRFKDPTGGAVKAFINSTGLAGKDVKVVVRDDKGDSSYSWNNVDGTSSPYWRWWPCCTDGMVLGNLPEPPTDANFDPYTLSYCVNFQFKDREGVNRFKVRTLNNYAEKGGNIIQNFDIQAEYANTLNLCYTQCSCPTNIRLTRETGYFSNKQVVIGVNGKIGRYNPGSTCSWIVAPSNTPNHIAMYFREFSVNIMNDVMTIYKTSEASAESRVVSYPDPVLDTDNLDWTTELQDSDARFNDSRLSSLYTYRRVVVPTSEALVSFVSDPSSLGGDGFTLYYFSVAEVSQFENGRPIVSYEGETVTILGQFFSEEGNTLKPEIRNSFGSLPMCRVRVRLSDDTFNTVYSKATYINENTVTCTILSNSSYNSQTSDATTEGYISVSNDGYYFHNEISFNFGDVDCTEFDNCGSCLNKGSCGWCGNRLDYNMSRCYNLPNIADPSIKSTQCEDTHLIWHYECCDICYYDRDNCSGKGECKCNSTIGFRGEYECVCESDEGFVRLNQNCSCNCPLGPNGEICSGTGPSEEVCNCDGTCSCETELYTGDTCECDQCRGDDNPCFGNGECLCNGTCVCQPGFTQESNCLCKDTCPPSDDNPCFGNGDCNCGVCNCYAGYDPAENCRCVIKSQCPSSQFGLPCSGNGDCLCNGTCTCYEGYEGDDCSKLKDCEGETCETCGPIEYCAFCSATQNCLNIYDEKKTRECTATNSTMFKNNECPVQNEVIEDPVDYTGAIVAIIIAAIILGLIIVAISFFLSKTGKSSLEDLENQFSNYGTSNPLYESSIQTSTNPLYEAN